MRTLSYARAIREAHAQLLASDRRVFVIGQGLWSPWYAGSSLEGLDHEFSCARMVDTPVSENATTGLAVGAALAGMRPIVFHPRMDFMLLAIDPIVNQAANWSYLFAGQISVPLVVRMKGTNEELGRQKLRESGLPIISADNMADAAQKIVAAVAGR